MWKRKKRERGKEGRGREGGRGRERDVQFKTAPLPLQSLAPCSQDLQPLLPLLAAQFCSACSVQHGPAWMLFLPNGVPLRQRCASLVLCAQDSLYHRPERPCALCAWWGAGGVAPLGPGDIRFSHREKKPFSGPCSEGSYHPTEKAVL